ncbi:ComF family protein [Hwanghaeella grinnelliae]|nr:ComF family protein [Hwanghaeella grinnelliae]
MSVSLSGQLADAARAGLDLLLPPRCPETGALISGAPGVSADAWRNLHFLAGPCCECCGLPFDIDLPGGTLCAACEASAPRYDRARAVLAYDEFSKSLLLNLKHGDRTDIAPLLGGWLRRAGDGLIRNADIVAPVPMHRSRLFRRRFNQAGLLAAGMTQGTGHRPALDLLERIRATPTQGHLSRLARSRNVRGAFAVRAKYRGQLDGKRVLLVDDVFTTGATVEECARVLRRAGVKFVDVITVARVLRPRH